MTTQPPIHARTTEMSLTALIIMITLATPSIGPSHTSRSRQILVADRRRGLRFRIPQRCPSSAPI